MTLHDRKAIAVIVGGSGLFFSVLFGGMAWPAAVAAWACVTLLIYGFMREDSWGLALLFSTALASFAGAAAVMIVPLVTRP